jgi:hypothetical protein
MRHPPARTIPHLSSDIIGRPKGVEITSHGSFSTSPSFHDEKGQIIVIFRFYRRFQRSDFDKRLNRRISPRILKEGISLGYNGHMSGSNFERMYPLPRPEIGRLRASARVEIRQDSAGIAGVVCCLTGSRGERKFADYISTISLTLPNYHRGERQQSCHWERYVAGSWLC